MKTKLTPMLIMMTKCCAMIMVKSLVQDADYVFRSSWNKNDFDSEDAIKQSDEFVNEANCKLPWDLVLMFY